MSEKLTIWVICERGLTGTENQCLGVAQALNGEILTKRIGLKFPYRLWSPFLSWGEGPRMLATGSDPITPPWPDIVIAAGRKSIGIARYIRRTSAGKTFVCLLQHPRVRLDDFDLVAMPAHDGPDGCHPGQGHRPRPGTFLFWGGSRIRPSGRSGMTPIMYTHGAPNRITPDLLNAAREKWAGLLSPLPTPRIAVLIGGNSKTHRLGPAQMDAIIARLKQIQIERNGSLMITVSRRTPKDLVRKLSAAFPSPLVGEGGRAQAGISPCHPRESGDPVHSESHQTSSWIPARATLGRDDKNMAFIYTGEGENPYHGFLAFADYIICTNDSTSMISDAATTGQPIEIIPLPGWSRRHDRFMKHLEEYGVTRDNGAYTPWNDAGEIARKIRELLDRKNG